MPNPNNYARSMVIPIDLFLFRLKILAKKCENTLGIVVFLVVYRCISSEFNPIRSE
jgi:hypothetical protein